MKKIILSLVMALGLTAGAHAAGGGIAWDKFPQEKATDLASLQTRAETRDKNEIPSEQVKLLRESIETIQKTHRERSAADPAKGFSLTTVQTLREPVEQHFRTILTLQEALKNKPQ